METQATEPSIPPTEHIPTHPVHTGSKPKLNKYIAIIVVLAIIVALIFYLKPLTHKEAQEQPSIQPPTENITPEIKPVQLESSSLLVWNVEIPTSTAAGNPLSIFFLLNNSGNASVKETTITAKIDETDVYTKQLADFAANATETLGVTLMPADTTYPKAGDHTLFIFADGRAIYSKDFTVIERIIAPNLEVRSFSTTPVTNVHIGTNVTLTAYIRNVGLADATNSTIRFYVNDELLKELPADIAQQITTPYKAIWIPAEAGDYVVKVAAYASGDVYTDNNEYSMNITVTNSTT
jgi:hypothetical protein